MKRTLAGILAVLILGMGAMAMAADYRIDESNAARFSALLDDLLAAHEDPAAADWQAIEGELDAIGTANAADGDIARTVVGSWRAAYVEGGFALRIHDGGEHATALEHTALSGGGAHAFVVLGCALEDGEMTSELMGRCEAAAAAARSFPDAILVCSGGATGENNPEQHTEAGLMKDYLVNRCGIDAGRIHIDERAMDTVENAVNTFAILEQNHVETLTLVTSSYHQRRSQVIYSAVGALYGQSHGYSARIVENYCYDIEAPSEMLKNDAQIAIHQLAVILGLPEGEGRGGAGPRPGH